MPRLPASCLLRGARLGLRRTCGRQVTRYTLAANCWDSDQRWFVEVQAIRSRIAGKQCYAARNAIDFGGQQDQKADRSIVVMDSKGTSRRRLDLRLV
jgi:hypothetical protein